MMKVKSFGKKAMTMGFIVSMMITLISFVLISGTTMRFMSEADNVAAENLCYDSISLRATTAYQLEAAGLEVEGKLVPPLCKTIDKEVSGTKEEVMKEVADSMARCWWMFGAGEYEEILQDTKISYILSMDSTEAKCFNCYNLVIDQDDFDGEEGILVEDLEYYMLNNNYRDSGMTYVNYIQSYGGPGRMVLNSPIYPNEIYTVSMVPKLTDSDANFWRGVGQAAVGTVVVIGIVGGVACTIVTAGVCGVVIGSTAAAVTTTVVTAAGTTGVLLAGGSAAYFAIDGYNEYLASTVDEDARDVSSVYLNFQAAGEEMCPGGDLAGE